MIMNNNNDKLVPSELYRSLDIKEFHRQEIAKKSKDDCVKSMFYVKKV